MRSHGRCHGHDLRHKGDTHGMSRIRPLDPDDGERLHDVFPALREGMLSQKSLTFHARTDHSFVLEGQDGKLKGVTLAQSVWNGVEPELRVAGIWVASEKMEDTAILLDAVVKSAYDAAVYRLRFEMHEDRTDLASLLKRTGWTHEPLAVYTAQLGSDGGVLRAAPSRNTGAP